MSECSPQSQYQLVFEGLQDESADTLRKLKGILIADLDLSIPEVQEILNLSRSIIKVSDSEADLKKACARLKEAGARVHIVRPQGSQSFNPLAHFADDSLAPPSEAKSGGGLFDSPETDSEQEDVVEFEMELEEFSREEPAEPKVYELEESSSEEVAHLMSSGSAAIENEPEAQAAPAAEAKTAPADFDLSIDMGEPEETAAPVYEQELVESPSEESQEAAAKLREISSLMLGLDDDTEETDEPLILSDSTASVTETEAVSSPAAALPSLQLESEEVQSPPAPEKTGAAPAPVATADTGLSLEDSEEPEAPAIAAQNPSMVETQELPRPLTAVARPAAVAVARETPVEALAETIEIPVPVRRKTRKSQMDLSTFFEILLPVGIGIGALVLANIFILPMMTGEEVSPDDSTSLESRAAAMLEEEKRAEKSAKKEIEQQSVDKDLDLKGEISRGALNSSWQSRISGKIPATVSITARTTPPPPLSREEAAFGKTQDPWVKKAQIEIAAPVLDYAGNFSWEGPAVIYIEHAKKGMRVMGKAQVSGAYDSKSQKMRLSYKVLHGLSELPEGLPKDTRSFISYAGSANYRVYLADEM